eukprot:8917256-Pyramimonas_sp.AAC.1
MGNTSTAGTSSDRMGTVHDIGSTAPAEQNGHGFFAIRRLQLPSNHLLASSARLQARSKKRYMVASYPAADV